MIYDHVCSAASDVDQNRAYLHLVVGEDCHGRGNRLKHNLNRLYVGHGKGGFYHPERVLLAGKQLETGDYVAS